MNAGEPRSFGRASILTLFILAVVVIVASYLFVLLMGYGFIFFTSEGQSLSMQTIGFPVFLFLFLGFVTPEVEVGAVFAFILLVYVLCFVAAWQWRESFSSVLGKSFSRPFRGLFSNFLFIMPLLSSMVLTAVLAIVYAQEGVGVPTGQPVFPPETSSQEIFLNVAYAPVVEEFGFRLSPIGLYTVLYVFLAGKNVAGKRLKLIVASVLYPEGAKRLAGLRNVSEHGIWRGISVGEWAMAIVTSLVFGFAHLISGIGWEPGKITSVFLQGFFFAVTYLAYGFEAPILLHWFFNYYLFFFDPDVISRFFPGTESVLLIVELMIVALGIAGWCVFTVFGLRKLLRRKTIVVKQEVPVPPPPPPESTLPS